MAGARYTVEIDYVSNTSGFSAATGRMNGQIRSLENSSKSFGTSFGSAIAQLEAAHGVSRVFEGALDAIKTGIVDVNAKIEELGISLAGTFMASGQVSSFGDGLSYAKSIIADMRKDAAKLPGTFKDLANIMNRLAPAAMGDAWLSPEETKELAAKAMAFGITKGQSAGTIGSEMAAILEGRATRRMPLVAELHLDPKKINAMTAQQRFALVTKELDKQKDAFDAYQRTWDGLASTLKDNVLQLLGTSTAALFEKMKDALEVVNNWFNSHGREIEIWAHRVGALLAAGFEKAFNFVASHAPKLERMLDRGLDFLEQTDLGATAKTLGRDLLELKGASVASAALNAVGADLSALGPIGAIAAIAVLGIEGAINDLTDTSNEFNGISKKIWTNTVHDAEAATSELSRAWSDLGDALRPIGDIIGLSLLTGLREAVVFLNAFALAIEGVAKAAKLMAEGKVEVAKHIADEEVKDGRRGPRTEGYDLEGYSRQKVSIVARRAEPPPSPVQHITNHNTIVVNGVGDPERVARLTVEELNKISRSPKTIGPGFTWRNKPIAPVW